MPAKKVPVLFSFPSPCVTMLGRWRMDIIQLPTFPQGLIPYSVPLLTMVARVEGRLQLVAVIIRRESP